MKAYKLKENITYSPNLHTGRILCKWIVNYDAIDKIETVLLATPDKPQQIISSNVLDYCIKNNLAEEINLEDEKWIHPHLYKPIKKLIYDSMA